MPPGQTDPEPSVSVVVPTRDRPKLLARAVGTILQQDYAGFVECVVVFDRTAVDLPDLPLPDGRRLIGMTNTRVPGLAGARNTGALAASGDLLAFCDDDDEWLPGKLSCQVAELRRRPDVVAVSSGIVVSHRGREYHRVPRESTVTLRHLLKSRRMEVNPCNLLLRRRVFLERVGLVDETLPGSYAEDYEWLLRASRLGDIALVREPLVRINWHDSSWFAEDWERMAASLVRLLEKVPEFQEEPRGLARVRGQIAFYQAGAGRRRSARRWALATMRASWREPRAYLAMLASSGLVSAGTLLRVARQMGRGI